MSRIGEAAISADLCDRMRRMQYQPTRVAQSHQPKERRWRLAEVTLKAALELSGGSADGSSDIADGKRITDLLLHKKYGTANAVVIHLEILVDERKLRVVRRPQLV